MSLVENSFTYSFPAIRGIQAKKEYYTVMIPLKFIPKIFIDSEKDIPVEYRAQRVINKSRVPEITKYILQNSNDYVFSSLTASVDGNYEFLPFSKDDSVFQHIGKFVISMDSKILINDGQHRRAAIEEALAQSPLLGEETISVVLYMDEGLKRSQQMFADLNKHAVNTTKSISILFDHRDPVSSLSIKIAKETPLLRDYTDYENNSLAKYSSKIFMLSNIYDANRQILKINSVKKNANISNNDKQFVLRFWTLLCLNIREWNFVRDKKLSAKELRETYVHSHGVVLEALGILGNYIYHNEADELEGYIIKLNNINWNRTNLSDWGSRVIGTSGRISKSNSCVLLTANLIKQKLLIPLTKEEIKLENSFIKHNKGVQDE